MPRARANTPEVENVLRVVRQEFDPAYPVSRMRPHPRNPNQGDVGAIYESIQQNGFFGAVGVQRSTGFILWGNHRYEAAIQSGATTLPAMIVDCDDDEALRILLVDNRAAKLSATDDNLLVEILQELAQTTSQLQGTGYTGEDLDEIIESLGGATNFTDLDPDGQADSYAHIDIVLRLPRARATDELQGELRRLADSHGGRFIIKAQR